MSTQNQINPVSGKAAQDLSDHKYRFVAIDSDGLVIKPTSATIQCWGVQQNAPTTNQAVSVAMIGSGGITKIVLGATLDEGARVAVEYNSASDNGKAQAAVSGQYSLGVLKKGGAEDEIGELILQPGTVEA